MSKIVVQWNELRRFAAGLVDWDGPLFTDPGQDTAHYLRNHYGLGEDAWASVEAFVKECPDEPPSKPDPRDLQVDREFQVNDVAQDWHLLCGFAQWTGRRIITRRDAGELAREYLRERHGLSAGEWVPVEDFLATEEAQYQRAE